MPQSDNVPLHSGVQSLFNDRHQYFLSFATDWSIEQIYRYEIERKRGREREKSIIFKIKYRVKKNEERTDEHICGA